VHGHCAAARIVQPAGIDFTAEANRSNAAAGGSVFSKKEEILTNKQFVQ